MSSCLDRTRTPPVLKLQNITATHSNDCDIPPFAQYQLGVPTPPSSSSHLQRLTHTNEKNANGGGKLPFYLFSHQTTKHITKAVYLMHSQPSKAVTELNKAKPHTPANTVYSIQTLVFIYSSGQIEIP